MKTKYSSKYIVSSEGLEIYYWTDYRTNNRNKKKFIVLHPASSMNHTALEPLEKLLDNAGLSTINIDPRGTGYSQALNKKEHFSLEKYTSDISKILTKEGIEKPHFFGHSMGFMPIINYIYETNNADKIFGASTSNNFSETTCSKLLFNLFNHILRYNELAGSVATGLVHAFMREKRPYNDQSKISYGGNPYIAFTDVSLKEARNHCISGKEINKWNISEQLKKIDNRIILIYGDKDKMTVPEKAGNNIKNIAKNAHVLILKGDHDIPIKNPNSIAEIIAAYQ
jgi:pimeloyl-ACP methyl ester carboxylesterase